METFYYILISICLVALIYLSWQDFKEQKISKNVTLGVVFLALSFNAIALIFYGYEQAYQALMGGGFLGLVFLICLLVTKEKAIGMGDVYLFILMGLLVGLQNIVLSLAIMVFSALTFSLLKYKKITLKQKIPLVPFMTLGIFVTVIIMYFVQLW